MSGSPFRPSTRLALVLLCAHAAAGAAAWLSVGGLAGAAVGLLAMAAGLPAIHGRALLLARDSPAKLQFTAAGELRIADRIGRDWMPLAAAPRYVTRWLVIVVVAAAAGPARRMLITRDMLAPEPFRRLRIWALWGEAPHAA